MFEVIAIRILEWAATGNPFQAFLAEATSISRKTWDTGGPKRTAVKARAAAEMRKYGIQLLRDQGISDDHVEAWLSRFPETTDAEPYCLSMIIRSFSTSQEPPPETLALAVRMDEMAHELERVKCSGDFAAYKHAVLNTPLLDRNYFAETERELAVEGVPQALRNAQIATDWSELENATGAVMANSLISLMACWDLEFFREYSPLMQPFPFFESVMLRTAHDLRENPRIGRDMLHRPTRILLDLLAMMGDWFRRHGMKPMQKVRVQDMAIWLESGDPQIPAQKLWNWRSGRDAFLLGDLDVVWRRFTGAYDDETKNREIPPPPIPLFIAARIWEHLQLKVDLENKSMELLFIQPWYLWWWEHHRARLMAKGVTWGDRPWPKCIRDQSSWSGAKSLDSTRSSQSPGRSSKSRDSQ